MQILLIGPEKGNVTGQSSCFTAAKQAISNHNISTINTNYYGNSIFVKLFTNIRCFCLITHKLVFKKFDYIYFTCSRSYLGALKDLYLLLLSKFTNSKLICHVHGYDFINFYFAKSFFGEIIRAAYKNLDTLVVLTNGMKESLNNNFQNIEVIPNFFEADETPSKDEITSIKILFLSNIIYSKGIFILLDAFTRLDKKYFAELHIAGDYISDSFLKASKVKQEFEKKIKESDKIFYHGFVSGLEKQELLKKTNVFVLPTFYESEAFPLSILESMHNGHYIITTDHNCLSDFVTHKNGTIVRKKSVESLFKILSNICINPSIINQTSIYNRKYSKRFSKKTYYENIKNLFF